MIGVGAMAAVYKATHRNGNEVAIKVLHAEASRDEGIRKRFQREGYVANRVKHRGAVTVFDDDVTPGGSAFLVMELLHGENVEARRERLGGFVPLPEVLGIADQVLDVLTAAHGQGIIHRDIKPENLFLTSEGVVKVLDFGIARLRSSQHDTSLTMVGAMLGTPGFLSPEQARGMTSAVDHQTDIWGVGATLFTLLCGQHVQEARTADESMVLAATTPARSLASVLSALDPGVVAMVDRALAWDKRDRFPDAMSMQAELRRVAARVLGGPGASPNLDLELSGALSSPIRSEPEPPTRVMRLPDEPAASRASRPPAAGTEGPPRPTRAPGRSAEGLLGGLRPTTLALIAGAVAIVVIAFGLSMCVAVVVGSKLQGPSAAPSPSATAPR
ncbi:MAG: serine/threonine protein kinase [Polyangiaceae bacterium]|nr:serine/threonine protein kinase [Polyangiaceae bacterium]